MSETPFMTPPYTPEQRRVVNPPQEKETPAQRFRRKVATQAIDAARYQMDADQHPEFAVHFERQIAIGEQAIRGWANFYATEHKVPEAQAFLAADFGPVTPDRYFTNA